MPAILPEEGGREYACTPEGLCAATADLRESAASRKALVIFDEIASNVVRESGATVLRVDYRRFDDGERLVVSDDGVPFDPLGVPPPAEAGLERRAQGGVGLAIVRHWSKDLRYRRNGPFNELTVTI